MKYHAIDNHHSEMIKQMLQRETTTEINELIAHSHKNTYHKVYLPELVAYPSTATEVSRIVGYCNKNRIPVVSYGSGTSVEGQVSCVFGGISLDMSYMSGIIKVNEADMTMEVLSGTKRSVIDKALQGSGLFFPAGPGVDATIGGMISTRASGTNAVRYGTIRENIRKLTVVMPDGEIISTGTLAAKSATGYDLTHLFCGAEGTLGIITDATILLTPQPESIAAAACFFQRTEDAVNAVIRIMQKGIRIAQAEFLDEIVLEAVNQYSGTDYPVQPALFLEFHGSDTDVRMQLAKVKDIISQFSVTGFNESFSEAERQRIWQARVDAMYAICALRPQARLMGTDSCVPVSRLYEAILHARSETKKYGLMAPILGHVGDGNFHASILVDPDDAAETGKAKKLHYAIAEKAIELGGTCSGEHGVGLGKMIYMLHEHGPALKVMSQIKKALDPNNIMNPGKIFPS